MSLPLPADRKVKVCVPQARCGCEPDGPLRPAPVGGGGAALEDAAEHSRQRALAPGGALTQKQADNNLNIAWTEDACCTSSLLCM